MTNSLQIRKLALIAAIGCVILIGWANPAAARPIDDPALKTARPTPAAAIATRTHSGPSAQGRDWTLPIVLAGGVVLIVVATGGYARRSRSGRRAIA